MGCTDSNGQEEKTTGQRKVVRQQLDISLKTSLLTSLRQQCWRRLMKRYVNVRVLLHSGHTESRRSPADSLLDYGQSPFDNERVQSDKFSAQVLGPRNGNRPKGTLITWSFINVAPV